MKLEILPIENFSGLKYITIFKNNLHNHFGSCRKYYSQSCTERKLLQPSHKSLSYYPCDQVWRECRNVTHSGHVYGITAIKMYETRNVGCCSSQAPENRQHDILDSHVSGDSNYQWFQKGKKNHPCKGIHEAFSSHNTEEKHREARPLTDKQSSHISTREHFQLILQTYICENFNIKYMYIFLYTLAFMNAFSWWNVCSFLQLSFSAPNVIF